KDTTDSQLRDDVTRIRMLYGEHGYVRAIPDPVVEVKKVEVGRTLENRYFITIRIQENDQYRIGYVEVRGNRQFTADGIRGVLGLVPGQIFNETMLRNNFDELKKMYDSRGFFNFTPVPAMDLDETEKVVNLTINIQED